MQGPGPAFHARIVQRARLRLELPLVLSGAWLPSIEIGIAHQISADRRGEDVRLMGEVDVKLIAGIQQIVDTQGVKIARLEFIAISQGVRGPAHSASGKTPAIIEKRSGRRKDRGKIISEL